MPCQNYKVFSVNLPGLNAVVVVSVSVLLDRDPEPDGEVSHEDDSERKEDNRDYNVDPQPIVVALEVGDGRVAEVDFASLHFA
jgi:hypothetical protein